MRGDCEYVIRVRHKSGSDELRDVGLAEVKCTLTGNVCFCENSPKMCTRRTWALAYEQKRQGEAAKSPG